VRAEISLFSSDMSDCCKQSLDSVNLWYTRLAEAAAGKVSRLESEEENRLRLLENETVFREFKGLHAELAADIQGTVGTAADDLVPEVTAPERPKMVSFERAETSRAAMALARLSMTAGDAARLAARDHCISDATGNALRSSVVMGWDPIQLDSFLSNFWFDYNGGQSFGMESLAEGNVNPDDGYILIRKFPGPDPDHPDLTVLLARNPPMKGVAVDKRPDFLKALEGHPLEGTCFFYLYDGIQVGEAHQTLLYSKRLDEVIKLCRKAVLTLQTFSCFASGIPEKRSFVDFAESVYYIKQRIVVEEKLPFKSFLANCNDLGISVLGDIFFGSEDPIQSLRDDGAASKFKRISAGKHYGWFIDGLVQADKVAGDSGPVR
jgi:hypothetical protein